MSFLWRDIAPLVSATRPVSRRGVLAGLALGTALAMSGRARAADGDDEGARKFVADLASKAIALMADKSLDDKARTQQFHDLFVASFDLPTIGQFVLGRYWKAASPDQQTQFLRLFEQQEVLTWAGRFKSYNGEKLTVASTDTDANGGLHVVSHIERPGSQPIALDWKVAQSGGGWHVTDLSVEGASMALTLRQDFTSVLQSNGGKIDALLGTMQKKVAQLGAG